MSAVVEIDGVTLEAFEESQQWMCPSLGSSCESLLFTSSKELADHLKAAHSIRLVDPASEKAPMDVEASEAAAPSSLAQEHPLPTLSSAPLSAPAPLIEESCEEEGTTLNLIRQDTDDADSPPPLDVEINVLPAITLEQVQRVEDLVSAGIPHQIVCGALPQGWCTDSHERESGKKQTEKVPFKSYVSPEGIQFPSMISVLEHLRKGVVLVDTKAASLESSSSSSASTCSTAVGPESSEKAPLSPPPLLPLEPLLVPKEFLCPLSRKLLSDPVVFTDGHTYEREAILEAFREGGDGVCEPPPSSDLVPNLVLSALIDDWCRVSGHPPPVNPSSSRSSSNMVKREGQDKEGTTTVAFVKSVAATAAPAAVPVPVLAPLHTETKEQEAGGGGGQYFGGGGGGGRLEAVADKKRPFQSSPRLDEGGEGEVSSSKRANQTNSRPGSTHRTTPSVSVDRHHVGAAAASYSSSAGCGDGGGGGADAGTRSTSFSSSSVSSIFSSSPRRDGQQRPSFQDHHHHNSNLMQQQQQQQQQRHSNDATLASNTALLLHHHRGGGQGGGGGGQGYGGSGGGCGGSEGREFEGRRHPSTGSESSLHRENRSDDRSYGSRDGSRDGGGRDGGRKGDRDGGGGSSGYGWSRQNNSSSWDNSSSRGVDRNFGDRDNAEAHYHHHHHHHQHHHHREGGGGGGRQPTYPLDGRSRGGEPAAAASAFDDTASVASASSSLPSSHRDNTRADTRVDYTRSAAAPPRDSLRSENRSENTSSFEGSPSHLRRGQQQQHSKDTDNNVHHQHQHRNPASSLASSWQQQQQKQYSDTDDRRRDRQHQHQQQHLYQADRRADPKQQQDRRTARGGGGDDDAWTRSAPESSHLPSPRPPSGSSPKAAAVPSPRSPPTTMANAPKAIPGTGGPPPGKQRFEPPASTLASSVAAASASGAAASGGASAMLEHREYVTVGQNMPFEELRNLLQGENHENVNHIEEECGVQLRLRGTCHFSHSKKEEVSGGEPLHFLIRAKNLKAMNEAREVIKDLLEHALS